MERKEVEGVAEVKKGLKGSPFSSNADKKGEVAMAQDEDEEHENKEQTGTRTRRRDIPTSCAASHEGGGERHKAGEHSKAGGGGERKPVICCIRCGPRIGGGGNRGEEKETETQKDEAASIFRIPKINIKTK